MATTSDSLLRRKWTFKAHGKQVVFVKHPIESSSQVLMKALLWALYLPEYPDMSVEVKIGDRYKPDVVAQDSSGQSVFWGEAGKVGVEKIRSIARRYRHTHFAIAMWQMNLAPFVPIIQKAVDGTNRLAAFDLLCFPSDSAERFIDARGQIQLSLADVEWKRF